jgi:hypothetical protein
MRTALAILVVVLAALLWLNPGMDDFQQYMELRSEELLLAETGDTALGRALSSLGGSLAGSYVDRLTERSNYFVFSTYTVDLNGEDEPGGEWEFVGIGGRFIETDAPQALKERRAEQDQ